MSACYCLFRDTKRIIAECLNTFSDTATLVLRGGTDDDVQKVGIEMFEDFLGFCLERRIIADYDPEKIRELWEVKTYNPDAPDGALI